MFRRVALFVLCGITSSAAFTPAPQPNFSFGEPPSATVPASPSLARHLAGEKPFEFTFVTGNERKMREVSEIVAKWGDASMSIRSIDLPELQGDDPLHISQEKARLASQYVNGPTVVEDVSLCFGALNGLPGPYIKWFSKSIGNQGLYSMLAAHTDKSAMALCALTFMESPNHDPVTVRPKTPTFCGVTRGKVCDPGTKEAGGWDNMFIPTGHEVTFAEMGIERKNLISHRANALQKFGDYIRSARDESA
ncbi:unnamed protein product [Chrysoparadoxa australica]